MFRTPLTPPQRITPATRGFTLVELLVVMAIIMILAGIVVGVQRGVYQKQSIARAKADLQALGTALESYKLKYGDYPWLGDTTDGKELFKHLTGQKHNGSTNEGPAFIDASAFQTDTSVTYITDPWGNAYRYYYRSSASDSNWYDPGFILMTRGADASTVEGSSSYTTGVIDSDHYSSDEKNLDDLFYGFEF